MQFRVHTLQNGHQVVQDVLCAVHSGVHEVSAGPRRNRYSAGNLTKSDQSSFNIPEMVIGQFLHERDGQSFSHHQQEGHGEVMISLIIVQLRVPPQNIQNDVNQLLLENPPFVQTHA